MNTGKLAFAISASGPGLNLTVELDHDMIYQDSPGIEPQTIVYHFDDSQETEHVLCFTMTGKLPDHTEIDDNGSIIKDRTICVNDLSLDDIQLKQLFTQAAHYHHDHNGTTDPIIDKFYGVMGCNGRVELRFTTPIYLWLLENM